MTFPEALWMNYGARLSLNFIRSSRARQVLSLLRRFFLHLTPAAGIYQIDLGHPAPLQAQTAPHGCFLRFEDGNSVFRCVKAFVPVRIVPPLPLAALSESHYL